MKIPTLAKSPVVFFPVEHKYLLNGKELKGVTSTLVERVFPLKTPDGMTEEEWQLRLNNAAERGSKVHEIIERYENDFDMCDAPELYGYLEERDSHGLTHVASEYLVSDEKHYASKIDNVYVDQDGGIVIVDIKTNYTPPYEKTALQLSIYKWLFELQNPKLKVSKCAMIWLREDKHEYKELTPWASEMVDELVQADINHLPFDIQKTYGDLPAIFAQVEREVARCIEEERIAKERKEKLIAGPLAVMEAKNVKSFTGGLIRLTRVLPSETTTIDSKRLKAEHPDLYEAYSKKTKREGSLRITVMNQ